jgi:hypothetical protein
MEQAHLSETRLILCVADYQLCPQAKLQPVDSDESCWKDKESSAVSLRQLTSSRSPHGELGTRLGECPRYTAGSVVSFR